jgi:hypothetical protein
MHVDTRNERAETVASSLIRGVQIDAGRIRIDVEHSSANPSAKPEYAASHQALLEFIAARLAHETGRKAFLRDWKTREETKPIAPSNERLNASRENPLSEIILLLKRQIEEGDEIRDPEHGTGTKKPGAYFRRDGSVGIR